MQDAPTLSTSLKDDTFTNAFLGAIEWLSWAATSYFTFRQYTQTPVRRKDISPLLHKKGNHITSKGKKKKEEKRGTSASAKRRKRGIMEKKGATHERGRRTNFSRRGKGTEYHTGGCLEDKMLHLSHLSSRCDFIISRVVDKLHFLPAKARKINFHQ